MGVLENKDKTCPCGRGLSLLKEVTGRTFDIVRTPSGDLLPGTFWTILSKAVPGVVQFQVVQKKIDEIEMRICTDSSFRNDGIHAMQEIISKYCGPDMNIDLHVVDHIPLGKTGKFRYVISEIN